MTDRQKGANKVMAVPTVARVDKDTIFELVYDPERRTTGLVVSRWDVALWNVEQEVVIGTGETLVPYSPRNNLIANECVLLPSTVEHHGDKAELLAAIERYLHKYVDLSPVAECLAAHYVLLTWVHDAFNELPYLRFRGEYGTGKTRALIVVGSICYRPFFASGASTVSPIFHTLDVFGGTLILDEADLRLSDATHELVKIFNNGNVRGLPVLRTVQNRDREYNPRAFRVFGPKLLAMRGSFDDVALESRFFTEEMAGRELRPDVPISLPSPAKSEALSLRNRLLHFRLSTLRLTAIDPSAVSPDFAPRLRQIAAPLLSLVDSPALRHEFEAALVEMYAKSLRPREDSTEARILSALRDALRASDGIAVPLKDVVARFNALVAGDVGSGVSNKWVGHLLRSRFGLSLKKNNGVYVIPPSEHAKIEALASRAEDGEGA